MRRDLINGRRFLLGIFILAASHFSFVEVSADETDAVTRAAIAAERLRRRIELRDNAAGVRPIVEYPSQLPILSPATTKAQIFLNEFEVKAWDLFKLSPDSKKLEEFLSGLNLRLSQFQELNPTSKESANLFQMVANLPGLDELKPSDAKMIRAKEILRSIFDMASSGATKFEQIADLALLKVPKSILPFKNQLVVKYLKLEIRRFSPELEEVGSLLLQAQFNNRNAQEFTRILGDRLKEARPAFGQVFKGEGAKLFQQILATEKLEDPFDLAHLTPDSDFMTFLEFSKVAQMHTDEIIAFYKRLADDAIRHADPLQGPMSDSRRFGKRDELLHRLVGEQLLTDPRLNGEIEIGFSDLLTLWGLSAQILNTARDDTKTNTETLKRAVRRLGDMAINRASSFPEAFSILTSPNWPEPRSQAIRKYAKKLLSFPHTVEELLRDMKARPELISNEIVQIETNLNLEASSFKGSSRKKMFHDLTNALAIKDGPPPIEQIQNIFELSQYERPRKASEWMAWFERIQTAERSGDAVIAKAFKSFAAEEIKSNFQDFLTTRPSLEQVKSVMAMVEVNEHSRSFLALQKYAQEVRPSEEMTLQNPNASGCADAVARIASPLDRPSAPPN